jgi:FkbM family methyltransferase
MNVCPRLMHTRWIGSEVRGLAPKSLGLKVSICADRPLVSQLPLLRLGNLFAGFYAVFGTALFASGSVIAIEAQERIFYSLAGNIAINNCFNASAIHAAVGAQDGVLDIPVPDYLKPSSFGSLELRQSGRSEFIGQALDPRKTQRIRMMAIDSLQLERLDFIKIDVEGMEMEGKRLGTAP